MNSVDIVFQSVTNLTGGLVTDVQTAVIALVTLGFICMGIDYLKDLLLGAVDNYRSAKAKNALWSNKGENSGEFKEDYTFKRSKRRFDKFDKDS